jgi:micrococcal nuclease
MSQHWNPRAYQGGRKARRYRKRGGAAMRFGGGEIRLVLLGGVFLGLAYALIPGTDEALPSGGGSGGGGVRVGDPWAAVIVDGDTFDYRGDRIRVADIDTPEVDGRCASETALAARASERMEALLHEAPFELHPIGGRDEDQYGRKLRVATREGRSLGDQMVAEGLARTWTGRREPWC